MVNLLLNFLLRRNTATSPFSDHIPGMTHSACSNFLNTLKGQTLALASFNFGLRHPFRFFLYSNHNTNTNPKPHSNPKHATFLDTWMASACLMQLR